MPIARLNSRALVSVSGPDARVFLQGLLTQNVETMMDGDVRYAALLGPQGRLLFDLFLINADDDIILDCAADRRDALIQRLSLYRLRANVRISPRSGAPYAAWDRVEPNWPSDPRLIDLGQRTIHAPDADIEESAWRAHCLAHGVPDAADFMIDVDYPIECNLDLLNAIDFQKGCFIGQEVASRMKRRGKVKSRLMPIRFEGAPPPIGTEILKGDLRAGEVRSGTDGLAMALLRLDRSQGELSAAGRPVVAAPPSWLGLHG